MKHMPKDQSTGFVSEDELQQLAEPPEAFAGDAEMNPYTAGVVCTTIATAVGISAILQDMCPTSACSTACP